MNQEKELLEKVKEQYVKSHGYPSMLLLVEHSSDNQVIEIIDDIAQIYATELLKLRLGEKFDATDLWNKATKFESGFQTNGYWKALGDLEKLGVIKMSKIEE